MSSLSQFLGGGGGGIKSVQKIAGSGANGATVTISEVDPDKTFISWAGGGRSNDSTYYSRVTAVSATSVTFYWGGGYSTSCYAHVVEFE